ncbi:MAG: type II secretion system protein GspG [Candidatus Levybacteria bacterium]|nr:type II secretion system protein GspG [Candidatus Levybacteria bacterium]
MVRQNFVFHPPIFKNLGFFQKGFTFIELIVVFGIIAIMFAAIAATLDPLGQFQKATDSRRKSDLGQIKKALETFYNDNGRYPYHSAVFRIKPTSTGSDIAWGASWTPYMSVLPDDPNSNQQYVYYSPDGQTYYLYARLERGVKDDDVCNGGSECTSLLGVGAFCSPAGGSNLICNYGVSSSNVSP